MENNNYNLPEQTAADMPAQNTPQAQPFPEQAQQYQQQAAQYAQYGQQQAQQYAQYAQQQVAQYPQYGQAQQYSQQPQAQQYAQYQQQTAQYAQYAQQQAQQPTAQYPQYGQAQQYSQQPQQYSQQPQQYAQYQQQYAQYQQQYPQYGQQPYGQYAPQPYQQPVRAPKVFSGNPVIRSYQKSASAVIFIVAISLYSANLLLSIISAFSGGYSSLIYSIAGSTAYSVRWIFTTLSILELVPFGLITAGLWILFADGIKGGQTMKPVSGTLIKIGVLIQLITTALKYAIYLTICVIATVAAGGYSSYYGSSSIGLLIFADILVAGLAFVEIFYFVKVLKAANDLRLGLTGTKASYLAKMIIIFNYIMAGIAFVELIALIIAGSGALSVISTLCIIGYYVLFNLVASSYNKTLAAAFSAPSYQ